MSKNIGVLGAGWLGFPLAISLLKKGYTVRGTTTSKTKLTALIQSGIQAFSIELRSDRIEGPIKEFLNGLDILVINIPPGLRKNPGSSFEDKMLLLHRAISENGPDQIVFVSSTSVYGNAEGEVTEDSPVNPLTESARQLLASELLLSRDTQLNTAIVRFGGLIGPDRHPVNHLAGRKDLSNGDDRVNLIQLDDCIHMICTIIEKRWWNQVFNGVYPDHPLKAEYYKKEAELRGLEPPQYQPSTGVESGKMILSKNFLNKSQQFYTSIHS